MSMLAAQGFTGMHIPGDLKHKACCAQAEVLVCAKGGGGLLKERKALAATLWEAGIKTELVHAAAPSQTFQYEWAAARNIHWLVTINAVTFSTTDTVQVGAHIALNCRVWGLRSMMHGAINLW